MVLNTQDQLAPVLESLRSTAVARDQAGGHAGEAKEALRAAGLLRQAIPTDFGGDGQDWAAVFDTVRRVAEVDSALAHVLAFHHLQVATVLIYGRPEQQARWLTPTAREGLWWGNAMNPLDQRLVAEVVVGADGEGYALTGSKGFCSGTRGSTFMTLSAALPGSATPLLAVVATQQAGVRVGEDWNPIGQRQTDSGSVHFARVPVAAADVLRRPGEPPQLRQSVRTCLGQLVLVHLYLGLAAGALAEARRHTLQHARPWLYAGVEKAADDPYRLQRLGEMHLQVQTAAVMTERAVQRMDALWRRGAALTPEQRRDTAVAIAEAKVLAHRASLAVSQDLFEVAGARATDAALGLDRFWRNARTHTLHDPVDYKLRRLGSWALHQEFPADFYN
ncbi:MAG TPA: acyl-CoA dehydrogenase family protein [Pseudorhodoferax sp.]|nr:acyl-CoA dehydrogenase family protein [Pseudorhodoferax sp.]